MSTLEQKSEAAIEHPSRWLLSGVRLTHRAGSAAAPSLGAMVMGERSGIETALIFLSCWSQRTRDFVGCAL